MATTSSSHEVDQGLILGWGAKIPQVFWPESQNKNNRSNIVTNPIKTLKLVHIKKKKKHPKNRIILTVVKTVRGHDKKVRQWGESKEKSRRENSVGDAQNLLEATKNFSSLYI